MASDSIKLAVQAGVDSGAISGVSGVCPYHPKSDESKCWYRARLLKIQKPDWNASRILLEVEKMRASKRLG